ncbi:MAG: hypothetical protein H7Z11_08745 [Verrucomicrobia bacterium]|nr:hypothetical protein [Leptolyngbya sp. ES-bin-22]
MSLIEPLQTIRACRTQPACVVGRFAACPDGHWLYGVSSARRFRGSTASGTVAPAAMTTATTAKSIDTAPQHGTGRF